MFLDSVDKNTGQRYDGISAYPLEGAYLTFDMTNPNQFDMRIVRLYLDMLKFVDADITGVWAGDIGGCMTYREYACDVEPRVGTYDCFQMSKGFDFIKLAFGEMEGFRIQVRAIAEGVYQLRLGVEYSANGMSGKVEADDYIQHIGLFDPVFHEPSFNLDARITES
jgi:hypothetical protein